MSAILYSKEALKVSAKKKSFMKWYDIVKNDFENINLWIENSLEVQWPFWNV